MKVYFSHGSHLMLKLSVIICLFWLTLPTYLQAQNLLDNCESVVFDAPRERYLASNWGDGAIIQMDKNGNQSYFNTDFQNYYKIAGLYIYGDTLLAASGNTTDAGVS